MWHCFLLHNPASRCHTAAATCTIHSVSPLVLGMHWHHGMCSGLNSALMLYHHHPLPYQRITGLTSSARIST